MNSSAAIVIDTVSPPISGFLSKILTVLRLKSKTREVVDVLPKRGERFQLSLKEESKDNHLHSCREAIALGEVGDRTPFRQAVANDFAGEIEGVEWEVYLGAKNLDLSSVELVGTLEAPSEKKPFKLVFSSRDLSSLDRPIYWLKVRVDFSKPVSSSEINLVLEKVEIRKGEGFLRSAITQPRPIYRRYETKLPKLFLILSLDGVSSEDALKFPHLKKLSEDSANFSQSFASSSVTATSASCLVSGVGLSRHLLYDYEKWYHDPELSLLSPKIETIGEYARRMGFGCQALTVFSKWRPHYGYARGFDFFQNVCSGPVQRFDFLGTSLKLIGEAEKRPTFVMLHLPGAHPPFEAGVNADEPNREMSAYLSTLKKTDRWVGALVGYLKETGLYDDTLLCLTSDHGRSVHPYSRRSYQFQETRLRVPLIVKFPKGSALKAKWENRVEAITSSTTTLYEVLADACGSELPASVQKYSNRFTGSITWVTETIDYADYQSLGIVGYDKSHKWVGFLHFDSKTQKIGELKSLSAYPLIGGLAEDSKEVTSQLAPESIEKAKLELASYLAQGLEFSASFPAVKQRESSTFSTL